MRQFILCDLMKWNHLPVGGGLYDQHPDLLDGFLMIFAVRNKHEREEADREKNKGKNTMGGRGASRSPRPRKR